MANDNVLPFLLQNALNRAYPSAPSSNQVLYQFTLENDATTIPDTVTATTRPIGYPYGWGEWLNAWSSYTLTACDDTTYPGSVTVASGNTTSTVSIALTEPPAVAWIIKLNAYQPSGTSVALSYHGSTLSPIDPSTTQLYGELFTWSSAYSAGLVGMSPWGTPNGWSDTGAWWICPDENGSTSDAPGQWLLRKWIYCDTDDIYTLTCAADATANVYIDGTFIVAPNSYNSASIVTVKLSRGMHLFTVGVVNYGTAANPTGFLFSLVDSQSNVIENGSSQQWETTGYINRAWSYTTTSPLFIDSYYVIDQPTSTSGTLELTLNSTTVSPIVNGLWIYSVAPWRWDEGGEWNATANSTLPITISTVSDDTPNASVYTSTYSDAIPGPIVTLK